MSTGQQFDRRLQSLLWDVCDASATSAQFDELLALLERDPRARRLYLQYTAMLTDLSEENIDDEVDPASIQALAAATDAGFAPGAALGTGPKPLLAAPGLLESLRNDLSARFLLTGISIALVGYFAAVLGMIVWQHGQRADLAAGASPPGLATVVATEHCRWLDVGARAGDRISQRALRLGAGKAELILDGGTRLAIEGPAELELQSSRSALLRFGQLAAQVPPAAIGFAVETPTARVVDLGTEFVVDVERAGQTDVHVFRGRVEVAPITATGMPAAGVVVSVGQAVRIGTADHAQIERIVIDPAHFDHLRQPIGSRAVSIAGTGPGIGLGADDPRSLTNPPDRPHGHELPAIDYLLLGNFFDDAKSVSLDAAQQSDTLRATADAGDFGVDRVAYGGTGLKQITPNCRFDFSNLGWEDKHYGEIANDAWANSNGTGDGPEGGIQTLGHKIGRYEPKIEEGIGMHANGLLTFNLKAIRDSSADWQTGPLHFVCDRCGLNDYMIGQRRASVHMVVLTTDVRGKLLAAWLDGAAADLAASEPGSIVPSSVGAPLAANGQFVSCRLSLPPGAHYLTLAVTSAGDGYEYDGAVWSGARLERLVGPRRDLR